MDSGGVFAGTITSIVIKDAFDGQTLLTVTGISVPGLSFAYYEGLQDLVVVDWTKILSGATASVTTGSEGSDKLVLGSNGTAHLNGGDDTLRVLKGNNTVYGARCLIPLIFRGIT